MLHLPLQSVPRRQQSDPPGIPAFPGASQCELVGIPLTDSIIVGFGREDYFSFRDASMLVEENQQIDRAAEERSGRAGR